MNRTMTVAAAAMSIASLASAPPASAQALRCPASGTVVERTNGPNLTFRGADPADPLVCLGRYGQRMFLGYWDAQSPAVRGGRAELARVFGGAGGQPAATAPISYFANSLYNDSIRAEETWRLAGAETVRVPAGTFDAVRVERVFAVPFSTYTFTETVWFDRRSGAPVRSRVSHQVYTMSPSVTNWDATEVSAPSVQSSR